KQIMFAVKLVIQFQAEMCWIAWKELNVACQGYKEKSRSPALFKSTSHVDESDKTLLKKLGIFIYTTLVEQQKSQGQNEKLSNIITDIQQNYKYLTEPSIIDSVSEQLQSKKDQLSASVDSARESVRRLTGS